MEERLKQIIEYLGISTRQFEQKISVSDGLIHKAMVRKSGLKSDTLAKIIDIFPQINPDWLIAGKGEMLRKKQPPEPNYTQQSSNANVAELIKILNRTLSEKDKQIDRLLSIIEKNNLQKQ